MSEFNLSEKRKEIKEYLNKYKNQLGEGIINEIICKIEEQDREFIKKLKTELHGQGEVNEMKDVDSHMIYMGDVFETIDRLAGNKLIGENNKS
ncbi:MAG: hypothetical protein ACOC3Z_02150 [Nanoarchaeota archaeon]